MNDTKSHNTDNAFVLTHFGNNPLFFEATLYFVFNLSQHTRNNIVWLYSVIDTPPIFVEIMTRLVFLVKPYNENEITAIDMGNGTVGPLIVQPNAFNYGVSMVRVCNWIFAYKLAQYTKLCLISNDMVIVKNMDGIFDCEFPAMRSYYYNDPDAFNAQYNPSQNFIEPFANTMFKYKNTKQEVLRHCSFKGLSNGGMMLIRPSVYKFKKYVEALPIILKGNEKGATYIDEPLFEYVNLTYYNIPAEYHTSHYHMRSPNQLYGMSGNEFRVFHYNETRYKPIDVAQSVINLNKTNVNYVDNAYIGALDNYKATGDWKNCAIIGYRYFKNKVYMPYKSVVDNMMAIVMQNIDKNIPLSKPMDNIPTEQISVRRQTRKSS
jgi:hypothetical protein